MYIDNEDKMKLEILQSMSRARKDNCLIKVRYGKVLVCGAGAAGKTNFLNLLMEEDFQPVHVSTGVAETKQFTIAMKAQLFENKITKTLKFTKMDIDNEIDQLMLYLPEKYTKPSNQNNVKSADEEEYVDSQEIYTIVEQEMSCTLAANVNSDKQILPTERAGCVWDILTFMDTGGQPQFISMLPAINNFAMITFIVHKMIGGKECFTEKVMVKHRNKDGKDSIDEYRHEYTYLELIKTLMSCSSSVLLPDKTFLDNFKESTSGAHNKKTNTSSISFVGTHSYDVSESDIKEIDNKLFETIKDSDIINIKPSLNANYQYLVPIDNKIQNKQLIKVDTSNSRQYTDPSTVREYIHEWLKKQDVYSVPIQWLLLDLEIRKVCINRKCSFITYNEVLKLSRDKNLGESDFIKNGLRFHHLFGVLLYFEEVEGMCELVITDHQWLFKKLTDIVLYSFKTNYKSRLDHINCEKKGIFQESLLDKLDINAEFEKSKIDTKLINPTKSFLNLLQHLRIIASLNEDPTQYFMPSLLKSCDLANLQGKIPGTSKCMIEKGKIRDSEPLLIQFGLLDNTNCFSRGIFCFLVVQLIYSTNWSIYIRAAYDNLLCFIKKDTAHYITLIDKIFFLEVQVTHDESNRDPVHDDVFIKVRDALLEVGNRLNIKIKLVYGFWCKKCENSHISLLKEYHEYCYCINEEPTKVEISHKIWFKVCTYICIYLHFNYVSYLYIVSTHSYRYGRSKF